MFQSLLKINIIKWQSDSQHKILMTDLQIDRKQSDPYVSTSLQKGHTVSCIYPVDSNFQADIQARHH